MTFCHHFISVLGDYKVGLFFFLFCWNMIINRREKVVSQILELLYKVGKILHMFYILFRMMFYYYNFYIYYYSTIKLLGKVTLYYYYFIVADIIWICCK